MSERERDDLSLGEHILAGDAEQAGGPSDDTSQEEASAAAGAPEQPPRDPVQGGR